MPATGDWRLALIAPRRGILPVKDYEKPRVSHLFPTGTSNDPKSPPPVSTHGSLSTPSSPLAGCRLLCPGRGACLTQGLCWHPSGQALGRGTRAAAGAGSGCCWSSFNSAFGLFLKCGVTRPQPGCLIPNRHRQPHSWRCPGQLSFGACLSPVFASPAHLLLLQLESALEIVDGS